MAEEKKRYDRLRRNTGQHRRIFLAALTLGVLAFVPVALRLYSLMISQYDYYADKALKNQTRTTTVSPERGEIFDRNMNILATNITVENLYLDPHELKQSKADIGAIAVSQAGYCEGSLSGNPSYASSNNY